MSLAQNGCKRSALEQPDSPGRGGHRLALRSCPAPTCLPVPPAGLRRFRVAENAGPWEHVQRSGLTPGTAVGGVASSPRSLKGSGVTSPSKGGQVILLRESRVPWRDRGNNGNPAIVAPTGWGLLRTRRWCKDFTCIHLPHAVLPDGLLCVPFSKRGCGDMGNVSRLVKRKRLPGAGASNRVGGPRLRGPPPRATPFNTGHTLAANQRCSKPPSQLTK